ncbi:Lrp/AsnC family transcriptional regulator [Nocardioides sp. cx-173]|uniref:Lrp/AsnC family transcriptional regulator n=1 Tax=Nocardioides sp. cx-173 TaxID=2898796 RepID=UPI001E63D6B3|nr:Lrp/AsnC family transcriptional regulator [Nocardioides sp. cx-173]MCD4523706.1 Lrp/AsnC family transcriptional regulator [Nocardioides sp. cx-173]UGB41964.1 Lrp/AsnC family transcriptional regulator [Nocardioides sp. cx-173]
MAVDEVDRAILDLLRRDARTTVAEIARTVRLSPAPVARRIARLEQSGVIRGYRAIIDDKRGGSLEAFTEIRLAGSTETGELAEILKDVPEIQAFYTIAGDPDGLVRIRVDDVDHLQRVVNAMRRTGKLTATKTLISLYSWERSDDPPTEPA